MAGEASVPCRHVPGSGEDYWESESFLLTTRVPGMRTRRRRSGQGPADTERHDEPLIRLRRVDADRGRRRALADVSLDICCGSVAAVIGPNGAGKSTLFAVMSRRLRPNQGEVHVEAEVAEVLQVGAVDERLALTVEDVARMGRYAHRGLFRPPDLGDPDISIMGVASC